MAGVKRKSNLAVVLISDIAATAGPDDAGTLEQGEQVARALGNLGYTTETVTFSADLAALRARIASLRPAFVFNLVETVLDRGGLVHLAPGLLEEMNLPFTGAGSVGMYISMNKLVAKRLLCAEGIPTPDWAEPPDWKGLDEGRRYIVKCATEHASIGLRADSVVQGREAVAARARQAYRSWPTDWFAESFVDGREFNIAILDSKDGPQVMPLAEMTFIDFPKDRPKIIDYAAKWNTTTVAYKKTKRMFLDESAEPELSTTLRQTVDKCWRLFGLRGWARVDLRVDQTGNPLVIDVNANPDVTQDAGMAAAAAKAGLTYDDLIGRIVDSAFLHYEAKR
jgi:D-alanine-D-alanine ligase